MNNPPKIFLRFFRWFCKPQLLKHIEGDLRELYGERLKEFGKRKADVRFIVDVLFLFRPGIIRQPHGYTHRNTYGMYKSYFKIGWRNLLRSKGYSLINIGGLAIGMTVAILNALAIWHEFNFNKYFENYDNIAHVAETGIDRENGGRWLGTTMTYPLATELIDNHREKFERIVRTSWDANGIFASGETKISLRGLYADADVSEMFSFKMISGSRAGLIDPHAILLSASAAKSLFGNEDALNRSVRMNNKTDLTVAGVYEDFPLNTSFYEKGFFASWELFLTENKWIEQRALTDWRNHFLKIYVEIPEGDSFESITSNVKGALRFDPADQERAIKENKQLSLYPMTQWHLYPPPERRQGGYEPIVMLKLIGIIGLFVLFLACINFMNLSTARSERRAKEVGIRKTIGSLRLQLINQFFTESFLVVVFAFIMAIILTSLFLPTFNDIATKNIALPWTNIWFWGSSFSFVIVTSFLAGSYPALYLSSFNPIRALKGTFKAGRLATVPRKVLVVIQFSISVILVLATIIVHQQIQFAKDRPAGYDREGLIMIHKKSADFNGKYEALRNELKNTGVVFEVSESMGPVTEVASGNNGWDWKGRDPNIDKSFATLSVSHLHGRTVGWQFLQGRDFDPAIPSDSSGIIINESALDFMKLNSPIGELVSWTWWSDKSRVMNYKILGVIKDMVMESPYAPAEPTIFYVKGMNGNPNWINIRIIPESSASDAISRIEAVFKKVIPSVPFEYKFVDEEYARKFGKEERLAKLGSIFAILAIFISCLGLLGLASFVAEQRTKEIGIRKILGATVTNLWSMLSRDFVGLVIISCVLAIPIAYYLLNSWLQKFDYHTTISIWILIGTVAGALLLTILMVSYQAIKAALMNPVTSLKSE
jgi:ABC-type antimicrobial peptide transport system permease subunit